MGPGAINRTRGFRPWLFTAAPLGLKIMPFEGYMKKLLFLPCLLVLVGLLGLTPSPARTDESVARVADQVNQKLVKLFGSGGFRGLASYGTGVVISPDGYILTIDSHILDTRDLRIHMADGTRYHGKVVAREPELDIALVKIESKVDLESWFDVVKAAKRPTQEPGTNIIALSNQFQIATRDEPMSVQRGVIAAHMKLLGRIGVFEARYRGNVYVVDAITNNPGAGGGVITTRKGELLGLIGKELRNELTNTWINYAVPFNASVEVVGKDGKKETASILDIVEKKEKYKPIPPKQKLELVAFHGIVLVPNVVERTPAYVEDVIPGSPAEKAQLKPDDQIVYVDGLPIPDINTFNNIIATYGAGQEVKLEIQRGDKLTTVPLKLERKPEKKK
jgi:S1-C subfamily serine protease